MQVRDRIANARDRREMLLGLLRSLWSHRRMLVFQFLGLFVLGLVIVSFSYRNQLLMSATTALIYISGIALVVAVCFAYYDMGSAYGIRHLLAPSTMVREVEFTVLKVVRVGFDRMYHDLVLFELPHGGVICFSSTELPENLEYASRVCVRKLLPGHVFAVETDGELLIVDRFVMLAAEDVALADLPFSGELVEGRADQLVARLEKKSVSLNP